MNTTNGKHSEWHAIDNVHARLAVGDCSCTSTNVEYDEVFNAHDTAVRAMADAGDVDGLTALIRIYSDVAWSLGETIRNLGGDPIEALHDSTIRGYSPPPRPSTTSDGRMVYAHDEACHRDREH